MKRKLSLIFSLLFISSFALAQYGWEPNGNFNVNNLTASGNVTIGSGGSSLTTGTADTMAWFNNSGSLASTGITINSGNNITMPNSASLTLGTSGSVILPRDTTGSHGYYIGNAYITNDPNGGGGVNGNTLTVRVGGSGGSDYFEVSFPGGVGNSYFNNNQVQLGNSVNEVTVAYPNSGTLATMSAGNSLQLQTNTNSSTKTLLTLLAGGNIVTGSDVTSGTGTAGVSSVIRGTNQTVAAATANAGSVLIQAGSITGTGATSGNGGTLSLNGGDNSGASATGVAGGVTVSTGIQNGNNGADPKIIFQTSSDNTPGTLQNTMQMFQDNNSGYYVDYFAGSPAGGQLRFGNTGTTANWSNLASNTNTHGTSLQFNVTSDGHNGFGTSVGVSGGSVFFGIGSAATGFGSSLSRGEMFTERSDWVMNPDNLYDFGYDGVAYNRARNIYVGTSIVAGTSTPSAGLIQQFDISSGATTLPGTLTVRGGNQTVASATANAGDLSLIAGVANGASSTGSGGNVNIQTGTDARNLGNSKINFYVNSDSGTGSNTYLSPVYFTHNVGSGVQTDLVMNSGGTIWFNTGSQTGSNYLQGSSGNTVMTLSGTSTLNLNTTAASSIIQMSATNGGGTGHLYLGNASNVIGGGSSSRGQVGFANADLTVTPDNTYDAGYDGHNLARFRDVYAARNFVTGNAAPFFINQPEAHSISIATTAGPASATEEVIIGWQAGNPSMTGNEQVLIGSEVGTAMTSATANDGIGDEVFQNMTTGDHNTAMGVAAMRSQVSASSNVAIGYSALRFGTTSTNSVAVGYRALSTAGNGNIGLGYYAGNYAATNNEFYVGNVDETNNANEKAFDLLYGTFSGVGGSTPSLTGQQLTVNGILNVNGGPLKLPNGIVSAPALEFTSSTGTGIFSSASNTLNLATSGAQAVKIDASGDVELSEMNISGNAAKLYFGPTANNVSISAANTDTRMALSASEFRFSTNVFFDPGSAEFDMPLLSGATQAASAPAYSFVGQTNTGAYYDTTNNGFAIAHNGNEFGYFRADTNGGQEYFLNHNGTLGGQVGLQGSALGRMMVVSSGNTLYFGTNGSTTAGAQFSEFDANHADLITSGDILPGDYFNVAFTSSATHSFNFLTAASGSPTGVPDNAAAHEVPLYYDSGSDALWAYRGSWRLIGGTAVATSGFTSFGTGSFSAATNTTLTSSTATNGLFIGPNSGNATSSGANMTGSDDIGIGKNALNALTSGGTNTAIGFDALSDLTTGSDNTAIGNGALGNSPSANSGNTALGSHTLQFVTGNNNTALGFNAMDGSSVGAAANSVALGAYAGFNVAGTSNEFFLNDVQQSSYANDQTFSLLYGQFSGTAGSLTGQQLTVNGILNVAGSKLNPDVTSGTGTTPTTNVIHGANQTVTSATANGGEVDVVAGNASGTTSTGNGGKVYIAGGTTTGGSQGTVQFAAFNGAATPWATLTNDSSTNKPQMLTWTGTAADPIIASPTNGTSTGMYFGSINTACTLFSGQGVAVGGFCSRSGDSEIASGQNSNSVFFLDTGGGSGVMKIAPNANGALIGGNGTASASEVVDWYGQLGSLNSAGGQFDVNFYLSAGDGGVSTRLTSLTAWSNPDKSGLTGTTTANASTTITGVGTQFLRELAPGDRISLSSAASTYAYVTQIASNTSLTVSTALGNGTSQTINAKRSVVQFNATNLSTSSPTLGGSGTTIMDDQGDWWIGNQIIEPTGGDTISTLPFRWNGFTDGMYYNGQGTTFVGQGADIAYFRSQSGSRQLVSSNNSATYFEFNGSTAGRLEVHTHSIGALNTDGTNNAYWFASDGFGTIGGIGIPLGNSLYVAQGTNGSAGHVALSGGTATVTIASITSAWECLATVKTLGTVVTPQAIQCSTGSGSITITSASPTDTSVVSYMLVGPF